MSPNTIPPEPDPPADAGVGKTIRRRVVKKWQAITCAHDDVDPGTFVCNQCGKNVEYTFTDPGDV